MDPDVIIAIVVAVVSAVALVFASAAETALERASDVRIQAFAVRGDARAQRIVGTTEQAGRFLGSLTMARVTLSSTTIISMLYIAHVTTGDGIGIIIYGVLAILLLAALQLGAGLLAARRPEATSLALSNVASTANAIFMVPAWLLELPGRLFGRLFSPVAFEAPADEDILSLMEREEAAGGVEEQEQRMIRGIMKLEDTTAHEIMVPRIDVGAVDIDDGIPAAVRLILERGLSRVPVYRETVDDIAGVVYAKDLLRVMSNGATTAGLAELLREPMFVPETKRLDELLTEMRGQRTHLAIVVDEYGGTAGLVTIEDLLEEIVGEIEDEYDTVAPQIERISDDEVVLDAGASTAVLADIFGYRVESEDFDTVGGLLIHELGRLPIIGDAVTVNGLSLKVLSMSGRRIRRVRLTRLPLAIVPPELAAKAEAHGK